MLELLIRNLKEYSTLTSAIIQRETGESIALIRRELDKENGHLVEFIGFNKNKECVYILKDQQIDD